MAARSCKFTGDAWLTLRGTLPGAPSETSNMAFSCWFKGYRDPAPYGNSLFRAGWGAESDIWALLGWHVSNEGSDENNLYPMMRMGYLVSQWPGTLVPHDDLWHHLLMAMSIDGDPSAAGYLDNVLLEDLVITEVNPGPPSIVNPQGYNTWCLGGDLSTSPTSHIGELTALAVYLEDEDYVTLIADADYRRQFITDSGWAADIGGTGFTLKPPTIYASGNVAAFTQSLPQLPALSPIMSSINLGLWKHDGNAVVVDGLSDPFIDG